MNFIEAMQALLEGKKVRCNLWAGSEHLRMIDGDLCDEYNKILLWGIKGANWSLVESPKEKDDRIAALELELHQLKVALVEAKTKIKYLIEEVEV